ncbi:MAG TPA: hypothetical protein PLX54_10050 [Candidatus Fermentibacter daniensis]|nr:hypothetical protein [Candidatus Fermentibacter daniensis]HOR08321.1 hypothetical protein [Candidatus Fermentibacter daniensis]HOZ18710.1 hypothetical protein [Candidatus Fermentibacter daniensis]HPH40611.1 hypothetical protein [Candidatus Fermentibacter daniensis]HPK52687.1 hypothetical protein [Candidatus Fermentibacter daniensis]
MSIYEAAVAMGSALGSITSPSAPQVRVVPPGHGDDRHANRPATCWINLELGAEQHIDENSASELVIYTVRFHGWTAAQNRTAQEMAQKIGTLGASIVSALQHNTLGGFATRRAITSEDIGELTYETAGEADTAYVVRGDVRIHRQQ